MIAERKSIFVCCEWYLPGFRAGGPIRSCVNFAEYMAEVYKIFVFTSDRDLNEAEPYENIELNTWVSNKNNISVYYASSGLGYFRVLRSQVRNLDPDFIYLNSMFSWRFAILPLLMFCRNTGLQIVLAPRGMLSNSALSFKTRKKTFFLKLFKLLKLDKRVRFHATNSQEVEDIRCVFPGSRIEMVENIPNNNIQYKGSSPKKAGATRLIFFSRIHPIKNLHFVLELFKTGNFAGEVFLDVYGDTESVDYLNDCIKVAQELPENIKIQFNAGDNNERMLNTIPNYHALVLPTLGENFGHVIFEALMSGVPVLISDQTPWRNLEQANAGWDIPLNNRESYFRAVQALIDMGPAQHKQLSLGARKLAKDYLTSADFRNKYISLFQK